MGETLKGKHAVVTGAGSGIGREVALALAREGAMVVVNDLGANLDGTGCEQAPADEVVMEIRTEGGIAVANYDSVADFTAAENIIETCVRYFGKVDILVNAAGNLRMGMIYEMSEDDWDSVIRVHLKGTFNCCRHACVVMRQHRGGRIINFTSDAWLGIMGGVNYSAAKGGIVSLTRALAREMGGHGVTCNAVAPIARTRMAAPSLQWLSQAGFMTKWMYDEMMNAAGPECVAPFIVYLATDEAANISGQVFGVSKGRIVLYQRPIERKGIYKKEAVWTLDELMELVPTTLAQGLVSPALRHSAGE